VAKVRVTRNYQVTIPSEVREELDIKEGDYVLIEAHGKDQAILKKVIPIESLAGAWDDEMDSIMEEVKGIWKAP